MSTTKQDSNYNTLGALEHRNYTTDPDVKHLIRAKGKWQAQIVLRLLPYFKITKLSEITGISRQAIYNWMEEYPQFMSKKEGDTS